MARLRVVLVEDGTFVFGSLRSSLEALDVDVVAEGHVWEDLRDQAESRSADLFVVVDGESPALVHDMDPGERPVLIVTDQLSDVRAAPAIERGAHAFFRHPLDGPTFHAAARAAVVRTGERSRLRRQLEDVQDQLETRKLVERAKGILMERLGLSEPAAFRRLQKASQDENRKMRDIADSIVRAEKVFGAEFGTAMEYHRPEREAEPRRDRAVG